MGTRARTSLASFGFVLGACLAILPAPASGQGGHPLPRTLRPLHERLETADAVVVATIGEVREGRIELLDPTPLAGTIEPRAELKRAPSKPLPVSSGDRVLLLLAGARSPYVSVDTARETIRLTDEEAEARWSEAIRGLVRDREDPAAWVTRYVGWLEDGPESLRDLAIASLSDPGAPYQPLPDSFFAARADEAWDPERAPAARSASLRLAATRPGGAAQLALLARDCLEDEDGMATEVSVLSAIRFRVAERDVAVLCALAHPHASVRAAVAKEIGRSGAANETLRARLAELSSRDPEPQVRDAAQRSLDRLN